MNNERRRKIKLISYEIGLVKGKLDTIRDDEECYLDNIPENLANSSNAMNSETSLEVLEDALALLDETIDSLTSLV